jgi:Ca-activated chloride channel family protein
MLIPAFHTTVSSVVILFNLYGNEKAAWVWDLDAKKIKSERSTFKPTFKLVIILLALAGLILGW